MGIIERVFRKIYKKPSWGATQGFGSMLMLDFGNAHLRIREPIKPSSTSTIIRKHFARRLVTIRGDWRLTIFACKWALSLDGRKIADSETTRARIRKAMAVLNGQALIKVSGEPDRGRWAFLFDLGAKLETRRLDRNTEQWWLCEPSGYTFSIRGDGRYSHSPPGTVLRKAKWRKLNLGEEKVSDTRKKKGSR
jgi:hypothetical protein